MEKPGLEFLKVGELAELKTFLKGYRGAWFRCKIKEIIWETNKIRLEYYDFEEEDITWEKIEDVPPYVRKSKHIKKQLMLRPPYPLMFYKSEMPPANSISEVCVVIDGKWKVGDMVDWYYDSCYWSARVIKVLSEDKVQIELPMPPAGEGRGEEAKHVALSKDLRPYLNWSQSQGWTLPSQEDHTTQLIFPPKQDVVVLDMDLEVENAGVKASSSTHIDLGMDLKVENVGVNKNASSSTTRVSAQGGTGTVTERQSSDPPVDTVIICEEEKVKMDDNDDEFVESSESISSLHVPATETAIHEDEDVVDYSTTDLNIMHEDTLEAAVIDLEELVNKIKWMKNILHNQSPSPSPINNNNNNNTNHSGSWKFV